MNLGVFSYGARERWTLRDHVFILYFEVRHVKEYLGLLELLRGKCEDRQRLAR
jgi:hypothetical protein